MYDTFSKKLIYRLPTEQIHKNQPNKMTYMYYIL
jgi:hypothetical protein